MIAFFTSVVSVPGWTGDINIGWPFLGLTLAIALMRRPVGISPAILLGLAFLAYAAASIFWTKGNEYWALQKLTELATMGLAFAYGSTLSTLRPTILGLGLGLGVSAILGVFQEYGFTGVLQTSIPGGLFGNSSIFGQLSAIALVACVMERLWFVAPLPALGMVLGQSRAGFMAAGIVLFCTKKWWLGLIALGALILVSSDLLIPLRLYGLFAAGKAPDVRLEIYEEIIRTATLFGHGLGSFSFYTSLGYAIHAHNDYLELFSELGVGSIPVFALLFLCIEGDDETARAILLAFLMVALFSFAMWVPVGGFMGAVSAGFLSQRRPMGVLSYRPFTLNTVRS